MENHVISSGQTVNLRSDTFTMWKRTILKITCFAIPVLLLIGAYFHMAIRYEKIWLFDTIVHERGKYTLWEVIFYFRHFLWELPMKTVYSFLLIGIFYYFGNPLPNNVTDASKPLIPNNRLILSGLFVLAIGGFSFLMAANELGYKEALSGLFQYRTTDSRPLIFGSHWRNHFLSNIVLYSTSVVAVLLFRIIAGHGNYVKRRFSSLFPLSVAAFIIITLFFGMTMDPFQKPSYLGHQLREIFGTDLTITMLLTLGLLIHLEGKYDSGNYPAEKMNKKKFGKAFKYMLYWSIPSVLISSFLIIKVLTLDISAEISKLGSTKGWSKLDLFAWHFFEHSIDYMYAAFLVYFLYLITLKMEMRNRSN